MKSRAGKRKREEMVQKRKDPKKEDVDARKGRNVAIHCVFPMICGSGGWKSRLAKAAGAEASGELRDEKVHAVVARSTFRSQNVQNTPGSDHFWKLRCWKSARRCGAKHISKSKCTKHTRFGPLLEVEMSKKCTPLWREAHFQVKMYKTHQVRTTFGSCDVEKVHAVVARSTFPSENVQNTPGPDHFWKLRCWKSARRCGAKHISKSNCTKHTMFGPLLEAQMSTFEKVHAVVARSTFRSQNVQNTPCSDHFWRLRCRLSKKCTSLWREAHFEDKLYKTHHVRTTFGGSDVASLNSTTLHYTTLCCTTLHYTTLHYTTLHNITGYNYNYTTTVHYTTLPYTTLHCTTLDPTTLHYITLHYTTFHYTSRHYSTLHSTTTTTLHYTPIHYTTLHYTTLHWMTLHQR